jgi:opacity protein-like surface antigen
MKKHLFALASAALIAPAAFAQDAATPAPVASAPAVVVGQPLVADGGSADGSWLDEKGHKGKGPKICKDPCNSCLWVYGEYINWKVKGDETPTLLTMTTMTPGAAPVTTTFGGDLNDSERQGFRVGGGFFPHCRTKNLGVEAQWFSLGGRNVDANFGSDATTTVGRPFLNAATGQQDVLPIGEGRVTGQGSASHSSRFWGGNVGLRHRLGGGCGGCGDESCGDAGCSDCNGGCKSCFNVLYGYQYYQLNESINVRTSQAIPAAAPVSLFSAEEFDNNNQYHGGYLGFAGEYNCGKWFIAGNAKAGIGYIQEVSRIRGSTTTTIGGQATTVPVGQLLALPSNVGGRVEDEITWSGEAGLRVGLQVCCSFRPYVGYNYIYIDQVQRPGGTVNATVNRAQLAGFAADPNQPSYSPRRDNFWAHGWTAGFELKF